MVWLLAAYFLWILYVCSSGWARRRKAACLVMCFGFMWSYWGREEERLWCPSEQLGMLSKGTCWSRGPLMGVEHAGSREGQGTDAETQR